MSDPVNSPDHYTAGEIECIDALKSALSEAEFRGFCKGNALKYLWRSGKKGPGSEDVHKAIFYSRMAIGDDPRKDKAHDEVDEMCDYCSEKNHFHVFHKGGCPAGRSSVDTPVVGRSIRDRSGLGQTDQPRRDTDEDSDAPAES